MSTEYFKWKWTFLYPGSGHHQIWWRLDCVGVTHGSGQGWRRSWIWRWYSIGTFYYSRKALEVHGLQEVQPVSYFWRNWHISLRKSWFNWNSVWHFYPHKIHVEKALLFWKGLRGTRKGTIENWDNSGTQSIKWT